MRLFAAIAVTGLLVSCGPSQAEIEEKARVEETAKRDREARAKEERRKGCEAEQDKLASANTEALRQNQNMVKTTLDDISRSGQQEGVAGAYGWSIEIESLEADEWRWVEKEGAALANNYGESVGRSDETVFTVDPRELSAAVVYEDSDGVATIKFTCLSNGCIRAAGNRVVMVNGQQQSQAINEQRDFGRWGVSTRTRATALADVMTNLLRNVRFTRKDCAAN